MKNCLTFFLSLCFTLQLAAQNYSNIVKQTVVFDDKGNIREVSNYHAFDMRMFCIYIYTYNGQGNVIKQECRFGQTFSDNNFFPLDSNSTLYKFTYKYDTNGRKTEETYSTPSFLETRCTYEYKGDTAVTATKYNYFNNLVETKVVYKLHKIRKTKEINTQDSPNVELYEKAYYDSLGKLTLKIKYTYGGFSTAFFEQRVAYGEYFSKYLNSVSAYDGKGKLLQTRKVVSFDEEEAGTEYDSTTVYVKDEEDGYDINYEDVYYGPNGDAFTFDMEPYTTALHYISCGFDQKNKKVETGIPFFGDVFDVEDFKKMQRITKEKLIKGYIVVSGK